MLHQNLSAWTTTPTTAKRSCQQNKKDQVFDINSKGRETEEIPLALRAEKPESLIGYIEGTRGRSEEMRLPISERENVERQRGCGGGDEKARVWATESLSAAEKVTAAGDDTAERLPVTLNILGLINNEFKRVRVERSPLT